MSLHNPLALILIFFLMLISSPAQAQDRIDVSQEDIRQLGLDTSSADAIATEWCSKISTSHDLISVYNVRLHTLQGLASQLSDLAEELELVYVQDAMNRALSPELRGSEYDNYIATVDLAIEALRAESARLGSEIVICDRWMSDHYNDPMVAYQGDELTTAREQCRSYALDNSQSTLWTLAIKHKILTLVRDARRQVVGFTEEPYILTIAR